MTSVDVVILSRCTSKQDFDVNNACLESLFASESQFSFNVIIVESNSRFEELGLSYDMPGGITITIPDLPFNFNRFLNIGLDLAKNDWVVFSNNDVVFQAGWLSEIFKVKKNNPAIQSFCPFDRTSTYLSLGRFNHKPFHVGYRVAIEFVGWCFVVQRPVFDKVGKFDEQFELYFGDNDFALRLKHHSIIHAMVPSSYVEHKGGYSTGIYDASGTPKYNEDKIRFSRKWKGLAIVSLLKKPIRYAFHLFKLRRK